MEAVSASELKDCPVFALGCPAMGAEELEEGTVEPFVTEVEGFATGKKIALFGSYDWGTANGCGPGRNAWKTPVPGLSTGKA